MSTEVTTEKPKAAFPREQVINDRAYILLQKEQAKQKSRGWSDYVQEATAEVDAWLNTVGEEATLSAWEAHATAAALAAPLCQEAQGNGPQGPLPEPAAAPAAPTTTRLARSPRSTKAPEQTETSPQA
jgi:hypothetical protein